MDTFKRVGLLLCLFLAVSCTRKEGTGSNPKDRLTEYISRSFSIKAVSDREKLLDYLTGPTRTRLNAWSDDQFQEAFMNRERTFLKLAFKEVKTISPTETGITYEISFKDQSRGHDAKVTAKKLALLVKEGEVWRIRDVTNINELVEFQKEMSLP